LSGGLPSIAAWLRDHIGLNAESISPAVVERIARGRMAETGVTTEAAYLRRLRADAAEVTALIDAVAVPETWFFRDTQPFELLKQFAAREWRGAHPGQPLRVLSIPCATGEEAYSIAISLLEADFTAEEFMVDAVDISAQALEAARRGIYRRHSFRERDRIFDIRYFEETDTGWSVRPAVRASVHFHHANALDFSAARHNRHYHVVFCRNLLIYLDAPARRRLVDNLDRLLEPGGLFFLGHAEAAHIFLPNYESAHFPRAFAARKPARPIPPPPARPVTPAPVRMTTPTLSFPPAPPNPPANSDAVDSAAARAALAPRLALARELADRGDLDAAEDICRGIVATQPICADAYCIWGVAALARNRFDQAETLFRKTLYLDPHHDQALTHLSLIMEKQGQNAQAERYRRLAAQKGRQPEPV